MADCDEWRMLDFLNESESDRFESVSQLDFGFATNCQNPTIFGFELRHKPNVMLDNGLYYMNAYRLVTVLGLMLCLHLETSCGNGCFMWTVWSFVDLVNAWLSDGSLRCHCLYSWYLLENHFVVFLCQKSRNAYYCVMLTSGVSVTFVFLLF